MVYRSPSLRGRLHRWFPQGCRTDSPSVRHLYIGCIPSLDWAGILHIPAGGRPRALLVLPETFPPQDKNIQSPIYKQVKT